MGASESASERIALPVAKTRMAACKYQMLDLISSGTLVKMLFNLADHLRLVCFAHHGADLACICIYDCGIASAIAARIPE